MLRKYIFPEELGRNIIWVMLSGFFLKIGAKENSFGQIQMPKDHYLFHLDKIDLDESYIKYSNLHYIFLDGPVNYLEDERFKKIKKKVNIHYVGKLNNFWRKIENSQPLFSNDLNKNKEIIIETEKKFPIFFKKYYLKKFLTTINNISKINLSYNHVFGKKKYVYYGYIKPNKNHLNKFQQILNLNLDEIETFFGYKNLYQNLDYKLKYICNLKNILINQNIKSLPYIMELLLFMIRYTICDHLKKIENCYIHDGLGGEKNYNAYEMLLGKQHIYLDFGSKVGFDKIYPRQSLLQFSNRRSISFNLEEEFLYKDINSSNLYLKEKIDEFFLKLNIKS
jgi:hypothetical protein